MHSSVLSARPSHLSPTFQPQCTSVVQCRGNQPALAAPEASSRLCNFSPSPGVPPESGSMAAVAPGAVQAFIEAQDLSLLEEKPLAFERAEDDFVKLLCCAGLCTGVASLGLTCFCTPVAVFCPGRLATHFHLQVGAARRAACCARVWLGAPIQGRTIKTALAPAGPHAQYSRQSLSTHRATPSRPPLPLAPSQLDKDAVQLSSAANDCCFHVALSKKTVPLDKVQDVQLTTGWVESLFGLQTVGGRVHGWVHGWVGGGRGRSQQSIQQRHAQW